MLEAAGTYRRTDLERRDQQVSWERPDKAFFASGACHVLAWACVEVHADRSLRLGAIRTPGAHEVWHTYAVWGDHAFDASGWHLERELVRANEAFEGRALERVPIVGSLEDFCVEQHHRLPRDFWADPWPRAQDYVRRFVPPWVPDEEVPGRRA
ncbi:hypothetical protein CFI00_12720 [Nocardioides sp. S5]|uniref:hypothetical protein n=1 Tax=Nocardioides sp. S5 TaxID=2017486 RepID=UPI001A908D4C|nr:hypothetical protein [Nocardioides sp. S5]QSR31350.1 hypothetical protein CFI00_12720 [Nocardioides sp. S5]